MKKLFLVIMLAMSISYSDSGRDLDYMNNLVVDCANRDMLKFTALMANMNWNKDTERKLEAIQLFYEYMERYCSNESMKILRIMENYNQKGKAAIIMMLISHQMKNISKWFKLGETQFNNYANNILDDRY